MVSPKLRGYSILAGFFLLGAIGGIAGGRAFTQHEMSQTYFDQEPQTREALFVRGIAAALALTKAEARHLASVAAKHRDSRRALTQLMYDTCGQPMRELQNQMNAEVAAGLRPDKAAGYLEIIAARRRQNGMAPR
jgi:hypothetical protein